MIPLKKLEMQGTEISSKLEAQRAIVINSLSTFGFRLSARMQRRRSGFFRGIRR
jgi:hypothetical protein